MNSAVFYPAALNGSISAPPSKSEAHRIFICAALADCPTTITIANICDDAQATLNCLQAMGACIKKTAEDKYCVTPICASDAKSCVLDCNESGSTLRFLVPVCAALGLNATFVGSPLLAARPILPLIDVLREHGIHFSAQTLPFEISGRLTGGIYKIPGDISSQFLTGLMLASPLLSGCKIALTTQLQSAPYIDITRQILAKFGANPEGGVFRSPCMIEVCGDWSSAAYWLCAGAIHGNIIVSGLDFKSAQGDCAILEILKRFGAHIEYMDAAVLVSRAPLHAINIDASAIPDLVPVLCAVACVAEGETIISNVDRLRFKESDRIEAIISALSALGANISYSNGSLKISKCNLHGGHIDSANDHRIAMMAAICTCQCSGEISVSNIDCISKSYPNFMADYKYLGGKYNVFDDGK